MADDTAGEGAGEEASTGEVTSGLGPRPDVDGLAATVVLAWVSVAAEAGLPGRGAG